MDRLTQELQNCFGVALAAEFSPKAVYHHGLDFIEYIADDCFVISQRVDEYLTLIKNGNNGELVGFKLKGAHFLYNEIVKLILPKDSQIQFIHLVPIITFLIGQLGDAAFSARKNAYIQVAQFAQSNDIRLDSSEFKYAA